MVDKLTWKALCALDAIREEAWTTPFAGPHVALRFVLAYLHWRGATADSCREFWAGAHGLTFKHPNDHTRQILRTNALSTAMQCICRSVGIEYTVSLSAEMKRARMKQAERAADKANEALIERRKRGDYVAGTNDTTK